MAKTLQDHHTDGERDRANGNGYNAPHSEGEKACTSSNAGMQKQADDNNAYKSGWQNTDKQTKK